MHQTLLSTAAAKGHIYQKVTKPLN